MPLLEVLREKIFKRFYWQLFIMVCFLTVTGIFAIFSASQAEGGTFAVRQLQWFGISVLALFTVVWIGYRRLLGYAYVYYWLSVALLLYVMFSGATRLGATRWISLGPFALQPSELAKIAIIMALAHYLGENVMSRYQIRYFIAAFMMVAFPMALILKQPDLGTALIFLPILFCSLFLWGVHLRYLIITASCSLVSLPVFWTLLKGYQKNRILVFFNPNIDPLGAGYTAIQSKIAVGSGQLTGKGFLQGTQNKLNFLPEHHTDFIFCVIAEEWGFVGVCFFILCFTYLFIKMFRVIESTNDQRGKLMAAGIISMIFFQVFINIGMTIGIMPITGLPLPFVSYGGSSLLTMFVAIGLLISIYKERSIF